MTFIAEWAQFLPSLSKYHKKARTEIRLRGYSYCKSFPPATHPFPHSLPNPPVPNWPMTPPIQFRPPPFPCSLASQTARGITAYEESVPLSPLREYQWFPCLISYSISGILIACNVLRTERGGRLAEIVCRNVRRSKERASGFSLLHSSQFLECI